MSQKHPSTFGRLALDVASTPIQTSWSTTHGLPHAFPPQPKRKVAMLQREARSFSNTYYPPSSKENQPKRSRRNNINQVAARERPFYREQEFHKNWPNRQTRHLVYFVRWGSHSWIYQYRLFSIVWVLRMFDWQSTQHIRVVGRRGLGQRKVTVNYFNKIRGVF